MDRGEGGQREKDKDKESEKDSENQGGVYYLEKTSKYSFIFNWARLENEIRTN